MIPKQRPLYWLARKVLFIESSCSFRESIDGLGGSLSLFFRGFLVRETYVKSALIQDATTGFDRALQSRIWATVV